MAAPVYATLTDYREWTGQPDVDLPSTLLRRASAVVDEVLAGAVYDVNVDDLPTDPVVVEALRDATCAQAEHFLAVGDTAGTGVSTDYESVKIGSLSLSGRTSTKQATSTASGVDLAPAALRALKQAGLLDFRPWVHG